MYRLIGVALIVAMCANSAAAQNFADYKDQLRQDALQANIQPATVDLALSEIHLVQRAAHKAHHQMDHRHSFSHYLAAFVPPTRVQHANEAARHWRHVLTAVAKIYHVQPEYIIALWGLETDYGRVLGEYPVLSALATLDYKGYRRDFFHAQLLGAMKMLDQHIIVADTQGSWAGAMGQCQFMPLRYYHDAVRYHHAGHANIWRYVPDVFASTANALYSDHWDKGVPVLMPVKVSAKAQHFAGLRIHKSLQRWQQLGLRFAHAPKTPIASTQMASLLVPDAQHAYLVFSNFYRIKAWNNSTYYALAVGELADRMNIQR